MAYPFIVPVLFSDSEILVINKPSGLLSLPDGYNPDIPHVRSILEPEYDRLWIVHRLDKETSGLLVLARTKIAHKNLNQQFQDRIVNKTYHAIVHGRPPWDVIIIDSPLKVDGDRHHRTIISTAKGKPACTECAVIQRWQNTSLLSIHPLTGYTHQIRAHLTSVGHSLLGDTVYTTHPLQFNEAFGRTALHSFSLQFNHPKSSQSLLLSAPYPADFEQYIKQNQPIK